jgi:CubicO group peptidase (beta-lactamase class C family)
MADAFGEVDELCRVAVSDGTVPGLVVGATDQGRQRLRASWGWAALEPQRVLATVETVYDVASLTKAIATSILAMQAVRDGRLALAASVADLLPELASARDDDARDTPDIPYSPDSPEDASWRRAMQVHHLLSHSAGFPAHRPFHELPGVTRARILRAAAREPLLHPPGRQSLYTDIGFMLLGWILERVAGDTGLERLFARGVAGPLGLSVTRFVRTDDGGVERARLLGRGTVAATERLPARPPAAPGRVLVGEVHDPNAFAMGGVAGHAGLFSNLDELDALAEALVLDWQGHGSERLVPRDLLREFWTPAGVPHSTWRLGWDGPARTGPSQAGQLLSRDAVGHLGFTGCSLWIDPERARWIVVLGNRIHPRVPTDGRFRAFRPRLHDAIVAAFAAGTR